MKVYRVEVDYGIDNQWTEGHYSTLEKAKSKAIHQMDLETKEVLEEALDALETEEMVLDDFTGPIVFGINAKLNGRWSFGVYVYQIEVE